MSAKPLNGYDLSKHWWNFAYTNTEVRPAHSALYFFIIDLYNRLTQPAEFGLPTNETMQVLGISNYKTYASALFQLEEWRFIKLVERSKNQYTSNRIALVKNTKAYTKALPKALHEAISEALPATPYQSIAQSTTLGNVDINKPNNLLTDKTDNYVNKIRVGVSFFELSPWQYFKNYHPTSYGPWVMKFKGEKMTEEYFEESFNEKYRGIEFANDNHLHNAVRSHFEQLLKSSNGKNTGRSQPNNIHSGGRKDFSTGQ